MRMRLYRRMLPSIKYGIAVCCLVCHEPVSPHANILPPTAIHQHTPCGAQAIWGVSILYGDLSVDEGNDSVAGQALGDACDPSCSHTPTQHPQSTTPSPRPAPFNPLSPHTVLPVACHSRRLP
jgi:hypothetical protein